MRHRHHRAAPFEVETLGWRVERHDLGIALVPRIRRPDDWIDASLQFFDDAAGPQGITKEELRQKLLDAMKSPGGLAPDDTPLAEVSCGAFGGWACEFVDHQHVFWRLWSVACGQTVLLVAYSTPSTRAADRRRHLADVDQILASLSVETAETSDSPGQGRRSKAARRNRSADGPGR
jgi:hypothetical protein